jgi:uncharacterized protein (DUF983 family)
MGPYYQHTTQGIGTTFDLLYEHPSLMVIFIAGTIAVGIYFWKKNKTQ